MSTKISNHEFVEESIIFKLENNVDKIKVSFQSPNHNMKSLYHQYKLQFTISEDSKEVSLLRNALDTSSEKQFKINYYLDYDLELFNKSNFPYEKQINNESQFGWKVFKEKRLIECYLLENENSILSEITKISINKNNIRKVPVHVLQYGFKKDSEYHDLIYRMYYLPHGGWYTAFYYKIEDHESNKKKFKNKIKDMKDKHKKLFPNSIPVRSPIIEIIYLRYNKEYNNNQNIEKYNNYNYNLIILTE